MASVRGWIYNPLELVSPAQNATSTIAASSTWVLSETQTHKLFLYENSVSYQEFAFLKAIIACESSWRPNVRGPGGEYGLFQILPTAARNKQAIELGLDYKNNPEDNIKFGLHIYRTEGYRPWVCGRKILS